jgi:16S rRNA C967 or C1407 C5-methylase (RsmB/RsmF family)
MTPTGAGSRRWSNASAAPERRLSTSGNGLLIFRGWRGKMDRVLIDAPCTGTGTWRRRPDAKWRISEKTSATAWPIRTRCSMRLLPMSGPGGELAYVTCSLLPEENVPTGLRPFSQRHPEFETISLKQRWRSLHRRFRGAGTLRGARISDCCYRPGAPEPTDFILPASGASPKRLPHSGG